MRPSKSNACNAMLLAPALDLLGRVVREPRSLASTGRPYALPASYLELSNVRFRGRGTDDRAPALGRELPASFRQRKSAGVFRTLRTGPIIFGQTMPSGASPEV